MIGTKDVDGRLVYVIAIEPKTPNKYLMRGRIWIDGDEYAITHIEGEPAAIPLSGPKAFASSMTTGNRDRSGSPSRIIW